MTVAQELEQFKEVESQESFMLQNSKLLKVSLDAVTIQAKLGSMVAYQGEVAFEHAGSGGVQRFIKKAVSGEGTQLMKMSGSGEVFLADCAQDIHLIKLEGDKVTANGANVLAFDAEIDWDIKQVEGVSGMLSGGLFNMELAGSGWVALVSDGPPMLMELNGVKTFADPQAAITWSSGVKSSVKTDVNLKTFIGKGSGETFQIEFSGDGWVLIQPSEGVVSSAASGSGSGSSGGSGGGLGSLLNR